MDTDGLERFVNRDWEAVRQQKADTWSKRTPVERLEAADALRPHIQRVQPGWPDASERAADLEHHLEQRRFYSRLRDRGL
jgi:hypothetical protein